MSAYIIVDVEVTDPETYQGYTKLVPATNASAAETCLGSSRVTNRINTFVSTARMPASNVPFDSFFQLPKRLPLGRPFGEQSSVHVIGCNLSRFSDNDPVAVLIPFEHGTGSYPEPATDLGRDRDLSLCGEPRLS